MDFHGWGQLCTLSVLTWLNILLIWLVPKTKGAPLQETASATQSLILANPRLAIPISSVTPSQYS